jgi:hypothetical protein
LLFKEFREMAGISKPEFYGDLRNGVIAVHHSLFLYVLPPAAVNYPYTWQVILN